MKALIESSQIVATAQIVDACMRLKVEYRIAPAGIQPVVPLAGMISGPAIPVRHYGSVDVFLESIETNDAPGIMVIDNAGRKDESCIGDLVVLEAKNAGIEAMIVWGLHRDTQDLIKIGLPVLSYGSYPSGPSRLDVRDPDAFTIARFDNFAVTRDDTVFIDQDGVVFVKTTSVTQVLDLAQSIRKRETNQAEVARGGVTLRQQFQFKEYLEKRSPEYSFRKHLSQLAKSIEE